MSSSATDYAARLDASYDPLDRVASQTYTLNGTSFLTNYGYDKSRLTQIQTNGAQTRTTAATANVNYAYTPSGQVQQITFPTLSDGTTLQENMTYDPMNRLTRISNTKGDSTLSVYSYQYDNNGNITSVTEQVKDGAPQTSTYSYDKLSRLTGVKRADGTETGYSYDLRGNRLTQKDTRDLPDEKATNYRYDLQNTLISVTKDSVKTALDYLPDGLRWKKTSGSKVTQYSYNGANQVIGDQTSNGTISSYIRGDRVLVKKDLTNQKDYYYLYNGHGDVVQMIGTDGSLVNSYQYDEWGNLTQQKETVANEFKYAGETYDAETGLYYLKARYYDPNVGRFLKEDTYEGEITNPKSLNLYGYVLNNPLIYTDPTGHYCRSNDGKWAHAGECSDDNANTSYLGEDKYLTGLPLINDGTLVGWLNIGATEHRPFNYNSQHSYFTSLVDRGVREDELSWFIFESIFTGGATAVGKKAATSIFTAQKSVKTVWSFIKGTQEAMEGTVIPKSFELTTSNAGKVWVHPNATKHMQEYVKKSISHNYPINQQALLTSFKSAVDYATQKGIVYDEMINIGGWELIFSKKAGDALPVIKHALFK